MSNPIVRLTGLLLRLLLPPSGRRRRCARSPRPTPLTITTRPTSPLLRGEDSRLVRPYLLAHEEREQARLQRQRRRALWLAVHGVDVGPRLIHGVEVA
ncbi:hypothetical protein ACFYV5_21140 [Streptomyces sp. NPDC003035]|uniref:hypothetical protein n=1 Tax=Streptomyces sp. NPDC003035 TaxID=3364676 RepID=UPI0036C8AB23